MTGLYRFHILLCDECHTPFAIVHDRPHHGKEPFLDNMRCPSCAMAGISVPPSVIHEVQGQVTKDFIQAFNAQLGLEGNTYSTMGTKPWPRKKKDGTE